MGNFAFIDSQNLNLGVRSLGWRVDYRKFRLYLRNKYDIREAYMFIGLVTSNQNLYTELQKARFILIFKPTVRYFVNGKETVKGNVDAELVLHAAAIQFPNYDKAVIVSGDGDFACLIEFLLGRGKLLKLLTPNGTYSKLLAQFDEHIVHIDKSIGSFGFRAKIHESTKKTRTGGRSKP